MPYLNLDDHFAEHPKADNLSDGAFRQLVRDICGWSKNGATDSETVAWLLDQRMVRRAPRHWLPDALLPRLRRHRVKIPAHIRDAVFARDGYVCRHCPSTDDLTLDHVVPWSAGGSDAIDNLQTLCRPCNSRKGART